MSASLYLRLVGLALLGALTTGRPLVDKRSSNTTISLRETQGSFSLARRQETGLSGGPQYVADFTLGSSSLGIIVDTGSTDLVLSSSSIPTDGSVPETDGSSCTEAYGGGSGTNGNIFSGPYSFSEYSVNGQLCGLDTQFRQNAAGIMGLGFYEPESTGTVSGQTGDSPLYQFNDQGLSSFAIYLSSQPGGGGAFTPNDYDQAYIYDNAPFATESVTGLGAHWSFGLANYQYDGIAYDLDLDNDSGFVDSGNPTIIVGASAAANIWSLTGANSDGTYSDCSVHGDAVTIVSASGYTYDIPASIYIIRNPNPQAHNGAACISAFQPNRGTTNHQAVLGTPFIKAYYTYFDIDNMQISFAQSAG